MPFFIPQSILSITLFLTLLTSCDTSGEPFTEYPRYQLKMPNGKIMQVFVAKTDAQQKKGLSGIEPQQFSKDWGMLFPQATMSMRQFWMPETHFNLDIIFMNQDYYVLDIHRNLAHYPKKGPRSAVPLSKAVFSSHVLEIRSDSPLAQHIKPGMILNFSEIKPPDTR